MIVCLLYPLDFTVLEIKIFSAVKSGDKSAQMFCGSVHVNFEEIHVAEPVGAVLRMKSRSEMAAYVSVGKAFACKRKSVGTDKPRKSESFVIFRRRVQSHELVSLIRPIVKLRHSRIKVSRRGADKQKMLVKRKFRRIFFRKL